MKKALPYMLFVLPILFFLPHLNQYIYQAGSQYSDLLISHAPNAIFLARTLVQTGQIPLWSPAILSGYPFMADPLSGLYYPPGWLALFLTMPLGFNLVLLAHMLWGGVGMLRLLREEGLPFEIALFGGLAFAALPKIYAHLGAGHISLVYAVAWTPWLLVAERRRARAAEGWDGAAAFWKGQGIGARVWPGVILAIMVLADVRWGAYAAGAWTLYGGITWLREGGAKRRAGGRWLMGWARSVGLAGLLAAPLLLPLMQFTRLSTRIHLDPAENLTLSLPPAQLLGLLFPVIGGAAEWVLYPGAVILLLACFAVFDRRTRRKAVFWIVLAAASIVFALGSYVPGMSSAARLPGMSLLRVPPRVLFLCGMSLIALAAYSFHRLRQGIPLEGRVHPVTNLLVFFVAAFGGLFGLAGAWLVKDPLARMQFGWGAAFLWISGLTVLSLSRLPKRVGFVIMMVFMLVDCTSINVLSSAFRPVEQVFAEGAAVAKFLTALPNAAPFRVYSPSYSLPQHTAAYYGLELADGVDPLQLDRYVRWMHVASGVPNPGYSVTVPALATGSPQTDNRAYAPDAALLGYLNVQYVVSAFPLAVQDLHLINQMDGAFVYQNGRVLPRAWVQPVDAPVGEAVRPVRSLDIRPNTLRVEADGPGMLVLSEVIYPGWVAQVDGVTAPIAPGAGLLRSIPLMDGRHTVEVSFRPWTLFLGLALCAITLTGLLVAGLAHRISFRKNSG